jgi:hypothetical protein
MQTAVYLYEPMFGERERTIVTQGEFSASVFTFQSGVAAVRLRNELGELVVLPFQGQQIWSATMDGRSLGMKSMFDQPYPTTSYLHTYGGFFVHCGATRMGVPGPNDTHPLHGELPNARYQQAWLTLGNDVNGDYIGISGSFRYTVAFQDNYVATPEIRLYATKRIFTVSLVIDNLKKSPMDLMYLAHINFRPVDHAQLITSAANTPAQIKVRRSIPSHITPAPGYKEFIEELASNPTPANTLTPGLGFDPEVVFTIKPNSDTSGWAHSIQQLPDGSADYVAHRPEQLPFCIRWISRTSDQDCLGFAMPATAEPEGYSAEKAKGNLQSIAGEARWRCDFMVGTLDNQSTTTMHQKIINLQ